MAEAKTAGSLLLHLWQHFAIVSKKCLARSALPDFAATSDTILDFIATYNAHHTHPFTWKKGLRFYHRLKDKLARSVSAGAA